MFKICAGFADHSLFLEKPLQLKLYHSSSPQTPDPLTPMNNPLFLDSSTASGRRFSAHLASFQSSITSLHQGIFSADGYCTHCGITSPHHFDKITCSMCTRSYHTACLLDKVGRGTVAAAVRNPSLWWFCLECLFVCNSVERVKPAAKVSPQVSGKFKPPVLPLPVNRRASKSREVVHTSGECNGSSNSLAVEDELQARLSQMESQIYNRLKSDMCRSLSQLSLSNNISHPGDDDSYDESDVHSLGNEGEECQMDSGIARDSRHETRRNGGHFSDDDAVVHSRKFSSSSGFSESQDSSKSSSFDKNKPNPTLSSTPKPSRPGVNPSRATAGATKSLSSSRRLSRTCPQLNQLDTTTDNDTTEDSDSPINFVSPKSSKTRSTKSGKSGAGAPIQTSRSAVFTPPRPRPGTPRNSRHDYSVDSGHVSGVSNERRRKNNEDLSEIKKLISLSKGINYNSQKINKRK